MKEQIPAQFYHQCLDYNEKKNQPTKPGERRKSVVAPPSGPYAHSFVEAVHHAEVRDGEDFISMFE